MLQTQQDNWNYYGEYIRSWYPDLLELLRLAGIAIESAAKRLRYDEFPEDTARGDFISEAFADPFLDYMRNELNQAISQRLFLAAMFIARKMLETIVIRLFEVVFPKLVNKQYSPTNHELWYDKKHNTFRGLDTLLNVLRERAGSFSRGSRPRR